MTRRIPHILILSLLMLAFSAATVFSARKAPERLLYNPVIRVIVDYALDAGGGSNPGTQSSKDDDYPGASLGSSAPSASPGAQLGNTYYDYQANSYQGRMVLVGRNFDVDLNDSLTLVHFTWMNSNDPTTLTSGHRGPSY